MEEQSFPPAFLHHIRPVSSCYVHIPFCRSICAYCAFMRSANLSLRTAWLEQIQQEIRGMLDFCVQERPDFVLKTLYFGGGTPTALEMDQLETLAALFRPFLAEDVEWTMEVNPDHVTLEDLKRYKAMGINRLSFGVQSFRQAALQKMNRRHTAGQAITAIAQAKAAGFEQLSADLIYGLPGQTMADLDADLEQFLRLDLPHLSIYSLQIEEDSVFGRQHMQPIDEDLEASMYEHICSVLEQAGYHHYEISSFARPGCYSRHNLAYWQDAPYLGVGCGAAGYDGTQYYNHDQTLEDYVNQGPILSVDPDADPAFCALMMGLRTQWGLDLTAWQQRYGRQISDFPQTLAAYGSYLIQEPGRLRVSEAGMELLNSILVAFLEEF